MHFSTLAVLSLAGSLAAAQTIPTCADECFLAAIKKSGCAVTDYMCQCTSGMKVISGSVVPCLCEKSTCSPADLLKVNEDTNSICSSALAAASKTFTPAPLTTNACQLLTESSMSSTSAMSSTMTSSGASTTDMSSKTTGTTKTNAGGKSMGSSMTSPMSSSGSSSAAPQSTSASPGVAPMVTMAPQLIVGGLAAAGMFL